MPYLNGQKVACLACIRGHRSTKCQHNDDRIMLQVKRPGRPLSSCPHVPGTSCGCNTEAVTVAIRRQGRGCPCPPKSGSSISQRPIAAAETPSTFSPSRTTFRVNKADSSAAASRRQSYDPTLLARMSETDIVSMTNPLPSLAPAPLVKVQGAHRTGGNASVDYANGSQALEAPRYPLSGFLQHNDPAVPWSGLMGQPATNTAYSIAGPGMPNPSLSQFESPITQNGSSGRVHGMGAFVLNGSTMKHGVYMTPANSSHGSEDRHSAANGIGSPHQLNGTSHSQASHGSQNNSPFVKNEVSPPESHPMDQHLGIHAYMNGHVHQTSHHLSQPNGDQSMQPISPMNDYVGHGNVDLFQHPSYMTGGSGISHGSSATGQQGPAMPYNYQVNNQYNNMSGHTNPALLMTGHGVGVASNDSVHFADLVHPSIYQDQGQTKLSTQHNLGLHQAMLPPAETLNLYMYPPNTGTFDHPLQRDEWEQSVKSGQFVGNFPPHTQVQGINGVPDILGQPTAGSNFQMVHNCSCGNGCSCLMCPAHPFNQASTSLVDSFREIQEDSNPADSTPHSVEASSPVESPHQSQDLSAEDWIYITYNGRGCRGDAGTCPCGDDCQCLACDIHKRPMNDGGESQAPSDSVGLSSNASANGIAATANSNGDQPPRKSCCGGG